MTASVWVIIIGVILFIIGAVLTGYGVHKHEDENQKTTSHKLMGYGGIALLVIGFVMIIVGIIFKSREKKGAQQQVLEIEMANAQKQTQLQSQNQYQGLMMNQGFGQGMNQGPMGMYNTGYPNQNFGQAQGPIGMYNTVPVQQSPYPMYGNQGMSQFSI